MFAVGSDGSIVPATLAWYRVLNFKVSNSNGTQTRAKVYNVNKCIIFAIAATLEVCFWTKRSAMSEANLVTYAHLIDNARRHVFHLKVLCTNILRLEVGKRTLDTTVASRNAVDPKRVSLYMKDHLMSHYPWLIETFGDIDCLDTNLGELFHKFVAKGAYEKSNRQYGAELMQMCNYVVKVEGSVHFAVTKLIDF